MPRLLLKMHSFSYPTRQDFPALGFQKHFSLGIKYLTWGDGIAKIHPYENSYTTRERILCLYCR